MLRKGVNKFRGYAVDREGVHHSLSSSCLALEIRFVATRATVRGRGRLYELDGLGGLVAPTTRSRYVVLLATRSHIVVRYADLDLRRLNHSSPTRYAARVRSLDGVLPIAKIGAPLSTFLAKNPPTPADWFPSATKSKMRNNVSIYFL